METSIENLGECHFLSPLWYRQVDADNFKQDGHRVLFDDSLTGVSATFGRGELPFSFEVAGPRDKIYFDPPKTTAAIVTCGGLCPGLNDIIRGIVMALYSRYGVTRIYGIRYGYAGLVPTNGHAPLTLRPQSVSTIHNFGGTVLGSSRGPQDVNAIVDHLEELGVDLLFVIGGDGTLRGGAAIKEEIDRRGLKKAVIGIPKTIDNDILYLDKSFGFETAFAEAVKAVACAHVEAVGAVTGVGLVKLMGRHSGFIACFAALAGQHVNFCLIPEVSFQLEGPRGFLEMLRHRIARTKHALIVVAEGAGQDLMKIDQTDTDASGNPRLGDIGLFLRSRISNFFHERRLEINLKYIDPSYTIRSVPASPPRQRLLLQAGPKRGARWHVWSHQYVDRTMAWHICSYPIFVRHQGKTKVDPGGDLWRSVLESTGQPSLMG